MSRDRTLARGLIAWQQRLGPLLRPCGRVYALLMAGRRALFAAGFRSTYRPPCPCISVGNIAWGGSGKTPLVSWLLRWAEEKSLRATVLTRGYGARPPQQPYAVRPDSPWREAGDEPLLLSRATPGARVLVDARRRRAAAWAVARDAPKLFLLDDGMQHLAMERDVELVLLRPEDLASQWGQVIPAGSWREGPAALSVASAFLIKADAATLDGLDAAVQARLGAFGRPVFGLVLSVVGLKPTQRPGDMVTASEREARLREGEPYVLVSGVAAAGQVERGVVDFLGRRPAVHLVYPDHHAYTDADWQRIEARSRENGDASVLCTAKDAVKLEGFAGRQRYCLETAVSFSRSWFTSAPFPLWWERTWEKLGQQRAH